MLLLIGCSKQETIKPKKEKKEEIWAKEQFKEIKKENEIKQVAFETGKADGSYAGYEKGYADAQLLAPYNETMNEIQTDGTAYQQSYLLGKKTGWEKAYDEGYLDGINGKPNKHK